MLVKLWHMRLLTYVSRSRAQLPLPLRMFRFKVLSSSVTVLAGSRRKQRHIVCHQAHVMFVLLLDIIIRKNQRAVLDGLAKYLLANLGSVSELCIGNVAFKDASRAPAQGCQFIGIKSVTCGRVCEMTAQFISAHPFPPSGIQGCSPCRYISPLRVECFASSLMRTAKECNYLPTNLFCDK